MIGCDYYLILGVDRGESQRGIRDAYRHLALRFHPDRAGEQSTELFREIVEAYQTLSDPQVRRSYDRGLEHAARKQGARPPIVTPSDPVTPTALGPLVGVARLSHRTAFAAAGGDPRAHRAQLQRRRPPEVRTDSTTRSDSRTLPDEAARGGLLRFNVPVYYACPACHGSGEAWPFVCQSCSGHGMVTEREQIAIRVPPVVEDGAVFEAPFRGLGIHNLYLRLWTRDAA
jgi:molecular chaperone DnaJ